MSKPEAIIIAMGAIDFLVVLILCIRAWKKERKMKRESKKKEDDKNKLLAA